jgi:hypothetical protein
MTGRTTTPREERVQWLDTQMRRGSYPNPDTMQEQLHIKKRTAHADIAHLRDGLGLPVAWDKDRRGWFYSEPCQPLPYLQMRASEAAALRRALLLARAYLTDDDAQALYRYLERVGEHVTAANPNSRNYESAGGGVRLLSGGPSPELLLACEQATRERRKLSIRYQSPRQEEPTERIVRPLHLHNENGEWCLITHCESRNDIRYFLLGRIQQWAFASEEAAYSRPADFDAEAQLKRGLSLMTGGEMVEVVLRFDAYEARWVRERSLHPGETRQEEADGSLTVRFRAAWGDQGRALVRWLLTYGHRVEVIAPPELRQALQQEALALSALYTSAPAK